VHVEREGLEVAAAKPGRRRIGDVLCQQRLARLMPAHLLGERGEDREIGGAHAGLTTWSDWANFAHQKVNSALTMSPRTVVASQFAHSRRYTRQELTSIVRDPRPP